MVAIDWTLWLFGEIKEIDIKHHAENKEKSIIVKQTSGRAFERQVPID